mmetsp:Transcript_146796/g.471297  ORF Transcript_146796/g.471297 Transcript_146796/m.471297 type:complete len:257 (+) Transcript_146796:323-1093(+)
MCHLGATFFPPTSAAARRCCRGGGCHNGGRGGLAERRRHSGFGAAAVGCRLWRRLRSRRVHPHASGRGKGVGLWRGGAAVAAPGYEPADLVAQAVADGPHPTDDLPDVVQELLRQPTFSDRRRLQRLRPPCRALDFLEQHRLLRLRRGAAAAAAAAAVDGRPGEALDAPDEPGEVSHQGPHLGDEVGRPRRVWPPLGERCGFEILRQPPERRPLHLRPSVPSAAAASAASAGFAVSAAADGGSGCVHGEHGVACLR